MLKHHNSVNPQSAGWLTAALDPYHDFTYEVDGLPDETTSPSVVQIHNQTLTLPAGQVPTGQWDASIVYTGFNSSIDGHVVGGFGSLYPGGPDRYYDSGNLRAATGGEPHFGALMGWTGPAGLPFEVGKPLIAGQGAFTFGSVLTTDRCRLIGVGLEIHNTTADVYRQGSLTVAQLSDVCPDATMVQYTDMAAPVPKPPFFVQADRTSIIASSLMRLTAVPGSQTWKASEGVYAVPRMSRVPRETSLFNDRTTRTVLVYDSLGNVATPEPWAVETSGYCRLLSSSPSGFAPLQVYLSGLSPQTTLTLTFRTIVEYFPAVGSPLLPLADPSPPFDAEAFEIYSRVAAEAPYAVPVGQNAAGDYFRKVMRVLSKTIDLGSPALGAYAPLGTMAAKALGYLGREKPKKVDKESAGQAAMQTRVKRRS